MLYIYIYKGESESVATACFMEYDLVEEEEKSYERTQKERRAFAKSGGMKVTVGQRN